MNADGKGIIEQQIASWIHKYVAHPEKKLHGSCNKIILRHLNIERKPQGDIGSFPVRLEEGMEDDIDPLVNAISDSAQKDADDMNQGVQTYAIYAYFPSDANYVPRKIFRVSASDIEIERDISPTEPPTEKGLVSQTMRHLESVMKTATVSMGYLVQSQQREMQRLSEQNEKFSQQQIDFMVLLQDTMNEAHKRRLDEKSSELNNAIKESAVAKLEALVPVIINRLAGTQVLPQEDNSFMMMASFLENLSAEQQKTLFNGLSDAQKITLTEVLAQYEKKKSKYLEGQKATAKPLGSRNRLPSANDRKGQPEQKRISSAPERETEAIDDVLVPESEAQPVPLFMGIHERLANPTPILNRDPVLEKFEGDTEAFINRFRDQLQLPKKPTTGE